MSIVDDVSSTITIFFFSLFLLISYTQPRRHQHFTMDAYLNLIKEFQTLLYITKVYQVCHMRTKYFLCTINSLYIVTIKFHSV